jgi:hypothetical protein
MATKALNRVTLLCALQILTSTSASTARQPRLQMRVGVLACMTAPLQFNAGDKMQQA